MNKFEMISAAALTVATFGAAAIAQDMSQFKTIDGNKDGFVSLEEAKLVFPTLTDVIFDQADENDDGQLDEGEFYLLMGLTAGVGSNTASSSSDSSDQSSEPSSSDESSDESSESSSQS